MSRLDDLLLDYRAAFLRFLPRREEAALATGYELGRGAVGSGVSLLELVRVHHEVLLEVLRDTRGEGELDWVAEAAADFRLEVLSTYDMAQRALRGP